MSAKQNVYAAISPALSFVESMSRSQQAGSFTVESQRQLRMLRLSGKTPAGVSVRLLLPQDPRWTDSIGQIREMAARADAAIDALLNNPESVGVVLVTSEQ